MTAPLFTADQLGEWLHQTIEAADAAMVERVVWGWLRPVLKVTTKPEGEDVSPELFSWAIELGGIAHENPSGLTAYQLGEERSQFSAERRNAILTEADAGGVPASSEGIPVGRFPTCREPYPDPARAGRVGPVYWRG